MNSEMHGRVNILEKVREVEKQISHILEQLEKDTGVIVREVNVVDMDVSTYKSKRFYRTTRIKFDPVPGTCWEKDL